MSEEQDHSPHSGKGEGADCEETIHTLYHYLDGELTEERRSAITTHLDECAPCLEILDFEAELRRVIADRCKDHVPEQLRERISRAIHHEATLAQQHRD